MPTTLPLSLICAVSVNIAAPLATAPAFNQGLYIGPSAVIPSVGAGARVRQYNVGNWSTEMLEDGFTSASPEYLAMGFYFSQTPAPQYGWVGVQDATSLAAVALTAGHAGAGYTLNDVVTVTQNGAQLGRVQITAVNAGVPTAVSVIAGQQGTGYAIAGGLGVTGGTGNGLELDVTAVGESAVQAVVACRAATPAWYECAVYGTAKADHVAIAQYAQAVTPQMKYRYVTADADVLAGTAGNVLLTLQAASYNRAFGLYLTTQGGVAPNNTYAAVAAMGVAMGLNTGLAGSYFTEKFKTLVGMTTEPLTVSQVTSIAAANGNTYVNYANSYDFLQEGVMANGQFSDEVLFLDMLAAQIQYNVVAAFAENKVIPQTDQGQQILLGAANTGCATLASIGFLQPGTWNEQPVLDLDTGDSVPAGYRCQSQPFRTMSAADKAARKMMPIYASVTEGGAGHSATVGIYVQR